MWDREDENRKIGAHGHEAERQSPSRTHLPAYESIGCALSSTLEHSQDMHQLVSRKKQSRREFGFHW
jgi:hypothetical protein